MQRSTRLALALFTLALVTGCGSTRDAREGKPSAANWLTPSPLLEQQMVDEAARLPWTRGIERIEQIRWFASIGEPAYETLLELSADPRDDVAAAALSALGATGDRRLVEHIRTADSQSGARGRDLRLERARTLLRLGDWSEVPVLIEGLGDSRVYTRALAIQALQEASGESHGFDPRGDDGSREKSLERWKRWWLARTGDPIRNSAQPASLG